MTTQDAQDTFEKIIKVAEAIIAKHGEGIPTRDISGIMPCPLCGKEMKYWIASYNGHRGARCQCFGTFQE